MLSFLTHFIYLCDTKTDVGNIFAFILLLALCSVLTAAKFACKSSQSLSLVRLFATPWTIARQAPLSIAFPRQEYWSELPFPPPRDLPNPWIVPAYPALTGGFFTTEPPRKPILGLRERFKSLSCLEWGEQAARENLGIASPPPALPGPAPSHTSMRLRGHTQSGWRVTYPRQWHPAPGCLTP